MRVFGSNFNDNIASKVKESLDKKAVLRVKAQLEAEDYEPEEYSTKDEAIEHAKSYWMMGWTWAEIETVLEDMGYSDAECNAALKAAQDYAVETLKDGPFAIFKDGQLLKLRNGSIGRIVGATNESATIELDTDDHIQVQHKDIDLEASVALREAYGLREAAHNLLREAQVPESWGLDLDDEDTTHALTKKKQLVPPKPLKDKMKVVPDPKEDFSVYTQGPSKRPKAPSGWEETTPRMSETGDLPSIAESSVAQLDALAADLEKVEKDNKELNTLAKEIKGKIKQLEEQQIETAKKIFAILSAQNGELSEINKTFFYRYKNKLLGLQRTVTAMPSEPGLLDKYEAVMEFLQVNHPKILKGLEEVLSEWMTQNTTIKEQLRTMVAYYEPSQKSQEPKKSNKNAQIFKKVKDWATNAWEAVKTSVEKLVDVLYPEVDEGIDIIDDYLSSVGTQAFASKLSKVLKERFNI